MRTGAVEKEVGKISVGRLQVSNTDNIDRGDIVMIRWTVRRNW